MERIIPMAKLKEQVARTAEALEKLETERVDLEAKWRENARARARILGTDPESFNLHELFKQAGVQHQRVEQQPLIEWVINELLSRKAMTAKTAVDIKEVAKNVEASGYKSRATYLHHVIYANTKKGGAKWDDIAMMRKGGRSGQTLIYYKGREHAKD